MNSFTFYMPTEILFGRGAEEKTAAAVQKHGGRRVLIVFGGGSVKKSGLLDRVERGLETAGVLFAEFGGAQPNPLLSHARDGVRAAAKFGADFILAIGGGSAIDTAKAIAHGAANLDIDLWDFWSGKRPVERSLPVGVVLTIAAAGSETSNSAVLTNEETGKKCGVNTEFNRPAFAIMNPELTYTLPSAVGLRDRRYHDAHAGSLFHPRNGKFLHRPGGGGALKKCRSLCESRYDESPGLRGHERAYVVRQRFPQRIYQLRADDGFRRSQVSPRIERTL